jgi:hypothetical protein
MTNEREIDRAIETAARAMMTREPSRALAYTVMARVREGHTVARRRFAWVLAAASVVVCGAIAMTLTSQAPTNVAPLPRAAQLTMGQPPTIPDASIALATEVMPARPTTTIVRSTRTVAALAPFPLSDVSPIEPLQTAAIALSSIVVPQLERETIEIDALNVEPLTIEPLATSND